MWRDYPRGFGRANDWSKGRRAGNIAAMATIFSERIFASFKDQFDPFLAALDIPESIFTRRDVEISNDKYVELLESVAREANPYIGLDMGDSLEVSDFGVMGHAMAASATVGDALNLLSRYLYVLSHSNTIRLDVGEDQVVCTYAVTILQPNLVRQDAEFAMSFIAKSIRSLSGKRFAPRQVEFSHGLFAEARRHQKFFDSDVLFDRRENRMHFSRQVLQYPVLTSDPGLLEALVYFLNSRLQLRSEEEDLQAKVEHLITVSLSEGLPDLNGVARQLGMSGRTLQRKLADKNLVFSEMLEAISRSIAREYILHSDYSVTDIAMMLGYTDLSSFSRAYKRWTGTGPQQAREAARRK